MNYTNNIYFADSGRFIYYNNIDVGFNPTGYQISNNCSE